MLDTRTFNQRILAGAVASGLLCAFPAAAESAGDQTAPYTVEDGKVGRSTYQGYITYTRFCTRCHGEAGVGSSFAPSLVDSMRTIGYDEFEQVLLEGRTRRLAGQLSVMPGFKENAQVSDHLRDLYAYLKARADGKVGVERPGLIEGVEQPSR